MAADPIPIRNTTFYRACSTINPKVRTTKIRNCEKTDFDVIQKIGSGASGTVFSIRHKATNKLYCWKELHYGGMSGRQKKQLVQEVNILGAMEHSHIVQYHSRIIDRKNKCIYLIQEYCDMGDLSNYLRQHHGRVPEDFVWRAMLEVTAALDYCHNYKEGKILHRDLKPQNILLTHVDGRVRCKLADFGVSKRMGGEQMTATKVGTPAYQSPEQINGENYNELSDIWSLGCVLYEICMKHPPFVSNRLSTKINTGRVKPLVGYSKRLSQVILQMLRFHPQERPTTREILLLPRHWLEIRSGQETRLYRRNKKLQTKMERWKVSNLKQTKLENQMKKRDEKRSRDLRKRRSKNEAVRENLKKTIDEAIMSRISEGGVLSAIEKREVMRILKQLKLPKRVISRPESLGTESSTTTDSVDVDMEWTLDSFQWSPSPVGTLSSGQNPSTIKTSSFDTDAATPKV